MKLCAAYIIISSVVCGASNIVIDDKLDSPFSTDCFKRIAIGERLIAYDVTRTSETKTVKECESECFLFHCSHFSFGISANGNGTCELSDRREVARRKDADYDMYERTKQCKQGKPTGYEQTCYKKLYAGKRLKDFYIKHSLPCDTIEACQHQCSIEPNFECHGFNIRLGATGFAGGICELTSVPSQYLNSDKYFHDDPEFDYFEKELINVSPNCGYGNEIINVAPKREGSGTGNHPNSIISLAERKEAWHPVKGNDRYDPQPGRSMIFRNSPPSYIIIDAKRDNLDPYYDHSSSHFSHLHPGSSNTFYGAHNQSPNQGCFMREYPTMQLQPSLVRSMYEVNNAFECEKMCLSMSFACTGFSFRLKQRLERGVNCYLIDVPYIQPQNDLYQSRDCDVYMRMPHCRSRPAHMLPTTECFSQIAMDVSMSPTILNLRVSVKALSECELECLNADYFLCRSFIFRPLESQDNCLLSDRSLQSIDHGSFYRSSGDLLYERGSFGRGCEYDMDPPFSVKPTDIGFPLLNRGWNRNSWQHFTVRGWPCRKGTQCSINKEAGFWSCEVEGGDFAQWDYCCKPQHPCGYSKGFHYPWCYVGEANQDQWRPCNERFYPNFEGNSYGNPFMSSGHNSYGHDHFGPPMFWPVSYIYADPPPNETTSYFQPILSSFEGSNNWFEESPKIQFKPSPVQTSYPRGIVQKLDEKDKPSLEVPQEDVSVIINPRNNFAKKLKGNEFLFSTTGSVSSNSTSFLPTPVTVKEQSLIDFTSAVNKLNETLIKQSSSSKTKDILEMVEKIILASKIEKPAIGCEQKNTSTTNEEKSDNSSDTEVLSKQETAMARFWNWSQQNYYEQRALT